MSECETCDGSGWLAKEIPGPINKYNIRGFDQVEWISYMDGPTDIDFYPCPDCEWKPNMRVKQA